MSARASSRRPLAEHARQSLGRSDTAIYRMVAAALAERAAGGRTFVDVGCGAGQLWAFVQDRFARYVAIDAVRYDGLPNGTEFHRIDLDGDERLPLPADFADAVAAVEVIEHLENPRALVRELARIARPGGWVLVTTPNQRSLLSLLTLIVKGRFVAFQDNTYPAHITALLEVDLRRIGAEAGLGEGAVRYSRRGRIPLTPWQYPDWLSAALPRALSDNVLFVARKAGPSRSGGLGGAGGAATGAGDR